MRSMPSDDDDDDGNAVGDDDVDGDESRVSPALNMPVTLPHMEPIDVLDVILVSAI